MIALPAYDYTARPGIPAPARVAASGGGATSSFDDLVRELAAPQESGRGPQSGAQAAPATSLKGLQQFEPIEASSAGVFAKAPAPSTAAAAAPAPPQAQANVPVAPPDAPQGAPVPFEPNEGSEAASVPVEVPAVLQAASPQFEPNRMPVAAPVARSSAPDKSGPPAPVVVAKPVRPEPLHSKPVAPSVSAPVPVVATAAPQAAPAQFEPKEAPLPVAATSSVLSSAVPSVPVAETVADTFTGIARVESGLSALAAAPKGIPIRHVESARSEGGVRRPAGPALKSGSAAAVPVSLIVPVPVPVPEVLPVRTSTPAQNGSGDGGPAQNPVEAAQPQAAPERLNVDDAALQVTIRQANSDVAAVEPVAGKSTPLHAVAETPVVPVPLSVSGPVAATPPAHVSPVAPPAQSARHAAPEAPAPRSAAAEEPVVKEPEKALKSLSLEFSPDGAGDVRLRVTERAGEVHISLHTSDPSLSGRIHEGVHDLVGTLTNAGYDAEAWTPGQGGRQQQEQEQQRRQSAPSAKPGDEDFGGIYEQTPGQETS